MATETNIGEDKNSYLKTIAENNLAPLWEIYENLVVDEPNRAEPPVIWTMGP